MAVTMSMVEARRRLTQLPEAFEGNPDEQAVEVTRRGKPVLAILPWDDYESIVETLEIMSDPELMAAIRISLEQAERGEVIPWEQVKAELDL